MADEAIITAPPEQVVEVIPPVPVEEERTHIYQPTDESGRPIGGKQVIKYRTPDELAQKLQEQNILLIRKLREQTRKNRLGIVDEDNIPTEAPQLREPVEFNPRQLSNDERVMLSRDLLDPDRFQQAADTLFEATLGAKPQKLREVLGDLQDKNIKLQAKAESEAFIAANPQYVRCIDNSQAITNWMVRYNLEPVRENFQRAYDALRKAGVLIENQEPEPEPETAVASTRVVETPAVAPVEEPAVVPPVAKVPGISSGLTRGQADNVGTPVPIGSDIVYEQIVNGQKRVYTGLQAINAMPSDEYKRRLKSDPTFSAKVDKLEQEHAGKRRK